MKEYLKSRVWIIAIVVIVALVKPAQATTIDLSRLVNALERVAMAIDRNTAACR